MAGLVPASWHDALKSAWADGRTLYREDRVCFFLLILYCLIFAGFFLFPTDLHRNIMYVSFPFGLYAMHRHREMLRAAIARHWKPLSFMAAFLVYMAASLFWSDTNEQGREFDKAKILLFLPVSMASLYLLTSRVRFAFDWLITAFVGMAAMTGIYLLINLGLDGWVIRLKGLGRADNSVMGGYLYAIAIMAVLYTGTFRSLPLKARIALCLLLGAVLFFTLSRGPMLALAVTVFLLCAVKKHYKFCGGLLLAAALSGAVIFGAGLQKDIPVINRPDTGRTQVWEQAIDKVEESPAFGHGAGSKFYYAIKNRHGKISEISSHPHNFYLATTLQGGVVALCFLLGMIGFFLAKALKVARNLDEYWPLATLISCCIMGLYDFGGLYTNLSVGWLVFWYQFALLAAKDDISELPH